MPRRKASSLNNRTIRPYIKAVTLGLAVMAIVLGAFAFIMSKIELPQGVEDAFSVLALGLGCLSSGFVAGKILRSGGLINGGKCGLLIFIVILIFSLFSGSFTGTLFLTKLIICLISGAIGGVIGVNSRIRI